MRLSIEAQPKAISTGPVRFAEDLKKYGISPNAAPELLWNFEKNSDWPAGRSSGRFAPDTGQPDRTALIAAIEV